MDLPIKFPSQVEVITEEVARFRALSPEDQVRELGEMYRVYRFLERHAARPDVVARIAREDEEAERKAVEAFVARHS